MINKQGRYFSYGTMDTLLRINSVNSFSTKFQTFFPTTIPKVKSIDFFDKKYDLVFFARVTKNKGVEDFIEALFRLKNRLKGKKNVNAIIIGGANESYLNTLKQQVNLRNLENNIEFAGFQSTQQGCMIGSTGQNLRVA
jgi:glycosyltransferase involved in cell wall biosynthesis